ncbi:MAG: hypothetical protein OEL89_01700 [Candidatus Peregrinibacteria bacterium]|nr:hypothetical protein [Candidatus Peregrinibacteria bacterium]
MKKRRLSILNVFILIILTFALIALVWNFSFQDDLSKERVCIEVNRVQDLSYEACYNEGSNNTVLEIHRGADNYDINSFIVSFFDSSDQIYELIDIPEKGRSKSYNIPSDRSPRDLKVKLKIARFLSDLICEEPREIFVGNCSSDVYNGIDVKVGPSSVVDSDDFFNMSGVLPQDSGIIYSDLAKKETFWQSQCMSNWNCSSWGDCIDGISRRSCNDLKGCSMPTQVPLMTSYCNGSCIEDWKCNWGQCEDGFIVPTCNDLNNCGTHYNVPKKLNCKYFGECVPDVVCDKWSGCRIDYNFINLSTKDINSLNGMEYRVCIDKNNCVNPQDEVRKCLVNVDIYTRKFKRCGEVFIETYNALNDKLVARVKEGEKNNPYLNIYLEDYRGADYCDYCFDGKISGDEEGIDCGGSCESCVEKYGEPSLKEKTWLSWVPNWIKILLIFWILVEAVLLIYRLFKLNTKR